MSKIVKLSFPGGGPGGKNVYYVNASQVIYWHPLPFEPKTQIIVSNGKILSVEQSMEEILRHVSKVIKVSMRPHDVELVYYVNPSQVTWLQPHPVETTGALIFLNDNKCLQVEQSIEEILPQLCKVIKISAQRGKPAYYVNALRVVWWEPHPVETGTLIFLNNDRFLHVDQSMEEILPQIS